MCRILSVFLAFYPRPNPNRSLSEDVDDITFADLFLRRAGSATSDTEQEQCGKMYVFIVPSIKLTKTQTHLAELIMRFPRRLLQPRFVDDFLADKEQPLQILIAGPDSSTTTILEDLDTNQYAFRLDVDLLGRNQTPTQDSPLIIKDNSLLLSRVRVSYQMKKDKRYWMN